ncbi:MAG: succinate dehydrogenase assembly factor 2 [Gammaproteobacteria bacterium]|nr:MAG: succinate dehydrogenase assembly factor 2 [Gammaproteobacteria bacterium]
MEKLRWRCRRGLLELDLMLGGFLRERYVGLSSTEQQAFEKLLALPDTTLAACLQGQENPPQELEDIVRKIRQ